MDSFPCADSRWKRNQKLEKSAVQWQKARGGRKWATGAGERKSFFFFLSELQSEEGLHLRNNPLEHTNRFMIHVHCHVTLEGRHAKKKKPSVVRDTNPFLSGHQWCILLFLDSHQWKNTAYRKHCPFTNILMPPFPPDALLGVCLFVCVHTEGSAWEIWTPVRSNKSRNKKGLQFAFIM